MFILNGKPLSPDRAFTTEDGRQFPANWLRLSTPKEKEAIGITEVPDNASFYDQRFYWAPNLPKDHAELVKTWVAQVKATAASLLQGTDWLVIRSQDLSSQKPIPDWALDERGIIRAKSDEKEAAIKATTTTDELASYVTSPDFSTWEEQPVPGVDDTITVDGVTSGTILTGDAILGGSGTDTLTF